MITNKLGFLVSPKKPIQRKQQKVINMMKRHVADFSHYMTKEDFCYWWNSLNKTVLNHPNLLVLGVASSTNYQANTTMSISANGIKQRTETIANLVDCKIHPNHKTTLFDWVSKVYSQYIVGSSQFSYYRNNLDGWIHLLSKDRIPSNLNQVTYINNPWVFETDWNARKVEIALLLKSNPNAIRYYMDGATNLNGGRSWIRNRVKNMTVHEKYENAMDTISNMSPMHWNRHLDKFLQNIAFRKFPEGECIGIELEFVSADGSELASWDSDQFPSSRWNQFCTDGSITTDQPDEVVARYQEYKAFLNTNEKRDWERVQNTLKQLTDNGGRINKSCGCHVHIDMRNRPNATYYRIAQRVREAFKSWLHRTISPRRATNRYCSVWADSQASRYSAVNTHCHSEHNTIEIRVGMPTLNYTKLNMWARLMFWVVNNSTKIDTFEEFMESECPMDIKVYVIERINKFTNLWNRHLSSNTHCGQHLLPQTTESTPTWDKWVNVISAIHNTQHDYSSDSSIS